MRLRDKHRGEALIFQHAHALQAICRSSDRFFITPSLGKAKDVPRGGLAEARQHGLDKVLWDYQPWEK